VSAPEIRNGAAHVVSEDVEWATYTFDPRVKVVHRSPRLSRAMVTDSVPPEPAGLIGKPGSRV
jgi:hypothetical protein